MQQLKKIINQMTKYEKMGTLIFILSLLIVQLTTGSTILGFVTGVLGIFYVILVRMGSKWCYPLCIVQIAMYIYIALQSKFYGDVTLNSINFILQFVGWYNWSKRENSNGIVKPKKFKTNKTMFGIVAAWFLVWVIGTYVLHILGGHTPYLDSFATVTSVTAMLLSINSYKEQWNFWLLHNLVACSMWFFAIFRGDSNSISMCIMMFAYLCNSILGYKHWNKLYKENKY